MAAGGIGLAGTDHVTDQLLSHVSGHVISETRKKFATGPLGLTLTQYGYIEETRDMQPTGILRSI